MRVDTWIRWVCVAAAVSALTPAGAELLSARLGAARSVQHLVLPSDAKVRVEVYGLLRRIDVVLLRRGAAVRAAIRSQLGGAALCHRMEEAGARLRLFCRTPRLEVLLRRTKTGIGLDILETRGVPWSGEIDGVPPAGYQPRDLGYPGLCPGRNPATQGECAFRDGDFEQARRLFEEAIGTPASGLARMRLGDLALMEGKVGEAAMHYSAVRAVGMVRRLTDMRLSELRGEVVEEGPKFERLYDVKGLSDPVRGEVELRAARVRAFYGRPVAAVRGLLDGMKDVPVSRACRLSPKACKAIALSALRAAHRPAEVQDALVFYLSIPERFDPPLSVPLAEVASERALEIGAPALGANLLAAVSSHVDPADLPDHLLRAASLYRLAGDRVRAQVVIHYAKARLPAAVLAAPAWQKVMREPKAASERRRRHEAPPVDRDSLRMAETMADAVLTQARARRLQLMGSSPDPAMNLTQPQETETTP